MARVGGERIQSFYERARNAENLGAIITNSVGAILLTIGSALASGILTYFDLFIRPISALIDASVGLVNAIFGGAAQIVRFGALSTALSVGPGGTFALGPFALAIAVAAILLALWLVVAYVSEDSTGNFVPGIPFDIPSPGFQGPEEEDE